MRQPETPEEIKLAYEALEGCPCEAIFDDGDQFDWNTLPSEPSPNYQNKNDFNEKKSCGCDEKKSSSETDEDRG